MSGDGSPAAPTVPLSPPLFLRRAGAVFSDKLAVLDGSTRLTYGELAGRVARLVAALFDLGVGPGDRVAALCANSHVMLELHNAVPAAGSVLVPLNVRLTRDELVAIVRHAGARLVVATEELAGLAGEVGAAAGAAVLAAGPGGGYEAALSASVPCEPELPDEDAVLAINYTSGSTGTPKGVMYSHRGAYLQALAMAYHCRLSLDSSYLWTLPMFHCDGWCLTWAVTAAGATHICLRQLDPAAVWATIASGGVTHLAGAPTVLTMLAQAAEQSGVPPPAGTVEVATGGAPPSPALLLRLAAMNLHVTHLYGLTESYGPAVVNAWRPEWSAREEADRAALNARQGIGNVVSGGVRVVDAAGADVPRDGATVGEIALRGNNVMIGYYKDPVSTAEAVRDGWLFTGDLGVWHEDGYVELRDRKKDIIITGGENVASVEVERTLLEHPAVLEAAVVAAADETWGEVPVAFVVLKRGRAAEGGELIDYCRERLAHFKAPREVRFEELPKTATGKVQKHLLRARLADAEGRPG